MASGVMPNVQDPSTQSGIDLTQEIPNIFIQMNSIMQKQEARIQQLEEKQADTHSRACRKDTNDAMVTDGAEKKRSAEFIQQQPQVAEQLTHRLNDRVAAMEDTVLQLTTMVDLLGWYLRFDWNESGRLGTIETHATASYERTQHLQARIGYMESRLDECATDVQHLMHHVGDHDSNKEDNSHSSFGQTTLHRPQQQDEIRSNEHFAAHKNYCSTASAGAGSRNAAQYSHTGLEASSSSTVEHEQTMQATPQLTTHEVQKSNATMQGLKQQVSYLQDISFDALKRCTEVETKVSIAEATARKAEQRVQQREELLRQQAPSSSEQHDPLCCAKSGSNVSDIEETLRRLEWQNEQWAEKATSTRSDLQQLEHRVTSLEEHMPSASHSEMPHDLSNRLRDLEEGLRSLQLSSHSHERFASLDNAIAEMQQRVAAIEGDLEAQDPNGHTKDLSHRLENLELRLGTTNHSNESDNLKLLEDRLDHCEHGVHVAKQRSGRLERRVENTQRSLANCQERLEAAEGQLDEVSKDVDQFASSFNETVDQLKEMQESSSTRLSIVENELQSV